MGYEGAKLTDAVAVVREETEQLMRDLADDGIKFWKGVTTRNTPIETFLKRADTKPPYHLRDSWELRDLLIFTEPEGVVYQRDLYTEVEYAPYVEEGTGLWGPAHAKYRIKPKRPGGWLSWIARDTYVRRDGSIVKPGDRVFAKEVLHPGSPGAHMVAIGAHMTEAEFETWARPAVRAWERRIEMRWRRLGMRA